MKNNTCYAQLEANNIDNYRLSSHIRIGGIIGQIGDSNISVENNTYSGYIAAKKGAIGSVCLGGVIGNLGGVIGKIAGSNVPAISNNYYKGASFGIGYDAGGEASDDPGCIPITPPQITTESLSNGVIKKSYSKTLTASGGTAPYTWTKSGGTLPTGLTLNKTTGKISGKPTTAGTFTFKVKVTDKNGATATKSYTVKITKPAISGTLSAGTVGKSYSKTLKATGGTAPYTWTKSSGTLPSGLKLAKTTGKISGTPTKAGKFTFKIKVTDKNGATATKSFTVTIKAATSSGKEIEQDDLISESESESEDENIITEIESEIESEADAALNVQIAKEEHDANSYYVTELHVMSDDVISQGTERDEDLVSVKANQPVRFIIGAWPHEVSDERVYVDDEIIEEIEIKEGTFTLPAEFVHDDFKVSVKAESEENELESQELYISATE